jgi:hypothetical protein
VRREAQYKQTLFGWVFAWYSQPKMAAATLTKGELLRWLNAELGADYHRIELLADGVAYLQLLDALNPGSAPLHKLNCE